MNKLSFSPFPQLTTKKLVLRQLLAEDAKSIYGYQSNKSNFPYVDLPVYKSADQADTYIEKMNKGVADNKWIIWAIANRDTNEIIGTITLWSFSKENTRAEIGYVLYPEYRGFGYMQEALIKVVEYGLGTLKLNVIDAYTNKQNTKSIALLKKCHFTKHGTFVDTETYSGEPMEMDIYLIRR